VQWRRPDDLRVRIRRLEAEIWALEPGKTVEW
jgi:hypothetical protein